MTDHDQRIHYTPSPEIVEAVVLWTARAVLLHTAEATRAPLDPAAEAARNATMYLWWGITVLLHPFLPAPNKDAEEGQAELLARAVEVCNGCPHCYTTNLTVDGHPSGPLIHYPGCPEATP